MIIMRHRDCVHPRVQPDGARAAEAREELCAQQQEELALRGVPRLPPDVLQDEHQQAHPHQAPGTQFNREKSCIALLLEIPF